MSPCHPCHHWVPPTGLCRGQTPTPLGQGSVQPGPGTSSRDNWGTAWGVLAPPLCPPRRLRLHGISTGGIWQITANLPESPTPIAQAAQPGLHAQRPWGWASAPSATNRSRHPACPACCQCSRCLFAPGMPRPCHRPIVPAAEWRGTTVGGETEAQGEVSQPRLASGSDQTLGPAATMGRASHSSAAGKVPTIVPAPPTRLPHQPNHWQ